MIKLVVEDYCSDCPNFEPDAAVITGSDGSVNTIVFCESKEMCRNIAQFIKKKTSEG